MNDQPTLQQLSEKLDEIKGLTVLASKTVLELNEAALFTGFSKGHLYRLTCTNQIPHYKKNRKLYFRKDELELWLTENRVPTQAEINNKAATYIATR